MVDEVRGLRLLRSLTDTLTVLRAEQHADAGRRGDPMWLRGERTVLDGPLASRMRSAVGFRNVLVHDYVRVDDDIVLEQLAGLADPERFVIAISRYLDATR